MQVPARAPTEGHAQPRPATPQTAPAWPDVHSKPVTPSLDARYRLEEFVVGRANALAFKAAERLADPASPRDLSPLYIHGACGLGKTHLLQGIAQRFLGRRPNAVVRYTTADAFTNEFVTALRGGKIEGFRRRYRRVALLCIDDAQFLSNKQATQGELIHTFDAAGLDGARLVIASDEPPRQVVKMNQSLVSRFMAGMVVGLELPDAELRERIVERFAERRGLRLAAGSAAMVAAAVARGDGSAWSVRDLEGAVTRLEAVIRLMPDLATPGGAIGAGLVTRALGGSVGDGSGRPRRPVRFQLLVDEVCRTLGVETTELLGQGRHKRVVLARRLVIHLARTLTSLSFPEIGRAMGKGNHSTVATAWKEFQQQLAADGPAPSVPPELEGITVSALVERLRTSVQRPGGATAAA